MNNQIAWLEKNIAETERFLAQDQERLQRNSDSICDQLVLASTEKHLADLRHQLYLAQEKRGKEIVDFHLEGQQAIPGTISLYLLGKIATEFTKAVHAAAYRLRRGKEQTGQLPKEIATLLGLRLVGLERGSTRLLISSDTHPNLFGQSLSQDTLETLFDVVMSEDDSEMTSAVSVAGIKASRSIAHLCRVLAEEKAHVEMRWSDPSGAKRIFNGNREKLSILSAKLMDLAVVPPEEIEVIGVLSLVGSKGQFEIETANKRYRGRYPADLFDSIKDIGMIGSRVIAIIKKEVIENATTGYSREAFTLKKITKIQDKQMELEPNDGSSGE